MVAKQEELIDTIYQASYQPERWPQAMASLTTLTGSKSAALFIQDKELKQVNGFFAYGVSKTIAALYRKMGAQIDPGFKRMQAVPVGTAHTIIDLAEPDREISSYENLLLRPAGVHSVLGVNLINNEQVHAGIGIHRSREQGSFDQSACALVELAAPHFTRAITIYREFARVNARKHAFHAGLERLSIGTLLFDHLARPVYINPRARYLFENHPAVQLRGDLPVIVDSAMAQQVHNAVIEAIEGGIDEQTIGLFHSDSTSPLVVRIVSVKEWEDAPVGIPGLARCVMYVTDPELSPAVSPRVLQQIYGLTAAESEVAVGLANGHSVDEIATLHDVQVSTVRVQIRSIFQKMNVSRQSELVSIILSLPAICNATGR